jgi:nucleoside-triphosphatase THEP1
MFDAQCDFAAVAYGIGDDPDRLLLDFAEDLRGSGLRVAGIIQLGRARPPDNSELDAVVLPSAERVDLGHHRTGDARGCRPDSSRLASVAAVIAAAISDGVDLVVINRFGKLEAEGQGLIHLIRSAIDADIPVVTAVPEHSFAAWLNYSDGMSVRLPRRRAALDHWWQSVAHAAPGRTAFGTFCEIAK